jgi:nitrogen-specific signal transduction histidine kinase
MDLSVGEAKQEGESTFVGIIHDLTERKHTEEQLVQAQKMEAVGQLSGGIAHDFNNLLTVIVGNAEILSEALTVRPDLKKLADTIVSAGERGAELTQRLLAFSRRQTLQPAEVDCNRLVGGMKQILDRTLKEDISVTTTTEANLWTALADPAQLESAILNLALNSQDAMPNGGTLNVMTSNVQLDEQYQDRAPEVPPGRYVAVTVTDDGTGMPSEVRDRAFEPFFTTKEVGKGSGLGLSMVYGFVKQSNGHVTIYSEVGLGTTVRLYLPAAGDPREMRGIEPLQMEDTAVAAGKETILVVEDDPFVRGYAVSTITSLGYRVVAAMNGLEALSRLSSGDDIRLMFSDIVMPGGMNGLELLEKARTLRPDLKVLLTSGYALETLGARGRLPPGTSFLNKPYRKGDLGRRLREVLDR